MEHRLTRIRRRALNRLLDQYLELDGQPDRNRFRAECRKRWPRLGRWFEVMVQASESDATLAEQVPESLAASAVEARREAVEPASQVPGALLGPWRVLEEVGVGGMGRVYRGERADGAFEKEVAIKLIASPRPGLSEHLKRECRLLARLDHPAITSLVDAGIAQDGAPFVVMEWVEGADLEHWLREHRPDVRQRLKVFRNVVAAVSHAHQRLVVHGDIKPGNVRMRADGQVKLMDFGVASLLSDHGETSAPLRGATPGYAAPEQLKGEAVTTRSDIWSLGALLSWLLYGRAPDEDAELEKVADLSGSRARELEAMVAMACAEDPEQRYASAQALATDVENYLGHHPLLALPPSLPVRILKYARRNTLAFGAMAAVVLALVTGVISSTLLYLQAEAERERAERHLDELEQVAQFHEQQLGQIDTALMGVRLRESLVEESRGGLPGPDRVESADAPVPPEFERLLGEVDFTGLALNWLDEIVLEEAVRGIDSQFSDQPLIRARLLQAVASTLRSLALIDRAWPLQKEALEVRRKVLGAKHPATLDSLGSKARLLREQGDLADAEKLTGKVLEARQRELGEDHPDTLDSFQEMGATLRQKGRFEEAEEAYRQALQGRLRVLGEDHPKTLSSKGSMGVLLVAMGRLEEAEPYMRQSLEGRRQVLGNTSRATLMSINNMGVLMRHMEEYAKAERYYQEALERSLEVRGEDHPSTLDIINNIGALLDRQGRVEEAVDYYRRSMEGNRRILGDMHPNTLNSTHNAAWALRETGHLDEAEALGARLLEVGRQVLQPGHWHVGMFAANYGKTLLELEEFGQAESLLLESYDILSEALGKDHSLTGEIAEHVVDLYSVWDDAAPGAGHDRSRREWEALAGRGN
ncbi:serine/threonine protein kinase [Wenzhouxiangella sp. AB-CW3]|uniref:serine/threonine-protein kinase n=1 Tax=Wenzhouxiangella sp. AB-CW3 TaxID=2771012 RepID=UPI00168A9268|nr:serine/threonine-protein kinase [Wenzhouxiangella sp. AB-CW3]QOC21364.1 serine/threonine protein kinase [Wenzhouxiangella sp. AB-CW3]